jgi:germination protein M
MVVTLCSCVEIKEEKKQKAKYSVYYLDEEATGLTSVAYNGKEKEKEKLIQSFLDELRKNRDGMVAAIPDNISVNGFRVIEKVLTVDFSEGYYFLGEGKELLCRAAIVMTLSQISGVQYISFTVNGVPLKINGELVEAMDASSFSSDMGGKDSVKTRDNFILYFANEDGTALKKYKNQNADYSGMSKEEYVVKKLLSGPTKDGYTETLPKKITVNNVTTVDNICYVDFGENFLTEQSIVANKLVIYSIVNSILELTDIHKVQITVNGKSEIYYHDDINLKKPLERNLDLVEES